MKYSELLIATRANSIKIVALVLITVAYYVAMVRNPLPSDEKMIAQFQNHRSDIEELIKRYRGYPSGTEIDHSRWFREGDAQKLLLKAGVDRISFSALQPWLPNPYTIKTAEKISREAKDAKSYALFYKYGALRISLLPRSNYRSWHLRYAHIWKDLYYIPEVPRIENNEILWPFDTKGKYSSRSRVLETLDDFPGGWKAFECVYREIEKNWLLRLCNGH